MKNKQFNFKFLFVVFAYLFVWLSYFSPLVHALDMNSTRFSIQGANVNSASGTKTSTNYTLQDTIGQTAAGQFSSTGYIVKAGFQYIHSIIPFQFSVSNINVSLGTLTPGTPSTATTNLVVSFGDSGQYQVTVQENNSLRTMTGNAINDTGCNGGASTCTISSAALWNSSSAYGFGYNMTGNDIPSDFISSSYFRPFPNATAAQNPQVVMSSVNVGRNRQSTMTFKANISGIQPAGSYQTVVSFVATPSY